MEDTSTTDTTAVADSSAGATAPAAAPSTAGGTEDALDLTDGNRLIRVQGSDKPVKFSDHVRGFQAQFTKASQEASRLRKELETVKQQQAKYDAERARQPQTPSPQNDALAALGQLPYLTGEHAVEVVRNIASAIQERDQVILGLAQRYQAMESQLQTLNSTRSQTDFDAYITKVLADGGFDPSLKDYAKRSFLAYEPEDTLWQEFPQIFADEMAGVTKIIEAQKAQRVAAAKRQPFIPGKGGATGPSKPLQMKGHESAKDVADLLWESMQAGADT
jgi:hypothetical protein